jgi:hypothetical protein
VASEADPPRYRLLESAREYALLELGLKGELPAVQSAHAQALLTLFRDTDGQLGAAGKEALAPAIAPELDNLRAALDWAARHEPQLAVELIGTTARSFVVLGLSHEHRRRSAALESALPSVGDAAVAARYWLERSRTLAWAAYGLMHDCARRAEALYRSLDNPQGIYLSLSYAVSSGLVSAGASREALDEMAGLERPDWPPGLRMFRFFSEYNLALYHGDPAAGLQPAQAGLGMASAAHARMWTTMFELWIVNSQAYGGDLDAALQGCRAALARERDRRGGLLLAVTLGLLARILLLQGKLADARAALAEFFDCSRATEWGGFRDFVAVSVRLALMERRHATAARLLGYTEVAWRHLGRVTPYGHQLRSTAYSALQRHMDAHSLERLIAEGASLDEEAVVTLALEPLG